MNDYSEEHRQMHTKDSSGLLIKVVGGLLILITTIVLGFMSGVQYQKSHQPKTATTATGSNSPFAQGGPGGFGQRRPTFGQVTAISPASISVKDQSGSSSSLTITSTTAITDNGQTVNANNIKVGDTVAVIADSSNSAQASRILVNPTFGGSPPTTN